MSKKRGYEDYENKISLIEVVDFLKDNFKQLFIGGAIAGTLGIGYALVCTPKYQATANIQVAKVVNQNVEDPNVLVEKMKLPMYYSQKSVADCKVMDMAEPGASLARALKPTLSKTAPIVTISYRNESPDQAKMCLESVLADIRANQNELATPMLESKRNQLANLKQKLTSAEKLTKTLSSTKPNFDFSDTKFSASALLLATSLSNENEVKDLRVQIDDLELALSAPQTKEAYLVVPIYAPNVQVAPQRTLIILGSFMGGGLLAVLFLIGRKMWGGMPTLPRELAIPNSRISS